MRGIGDGHCRSQWRYARLLQCLERVHGHHRDRLGFHCRQPRSVHQWRHATVVGFLGGFGGLDGDGVAALCGALCVYCGFGHPGCYSRDGQCIGGLGFGLGAIDLELFVPVGNVDL